MQVGVRFTSSRGRVDMINQVKSIVTGVFKRWMVR